MGGGGDSITCNVAVPPMPPAEAVISAVPAEAPLVMPEESTVAIPVSELLQLAVVVRSEVLPSS